MRYKLDNMDYYHIIANGTRVECTPLIQVSFYDPISALITGTAEHLIGQMKAG